MADGRTIFGAMPLPRPASPKALWADLRDFFSDRPRHSWIAAALAVGVAAALMGMFYFDSKMMSSDREQVIFVDSWPATRSDAEIRAKQKADKAERDAAIEAHRREMERIDQNLNRLGL